jgi:hypothetical protein
VQATDLAGLPPNDGRFEPDLSVRGTVNLDIPARRQR